MKILIENYRGFEIEFDTEYEKFQCIITDLNTKESSSFSSVKKFIDDYKKENQSFAPFWIEPNPTSMWKSKKYKIIGVRKDGRFVGETMDGKKEQISDYDLKDYIVSDSKNDEYFKMLSDLKEKEEQQRVENNNKKQYIISKMSLVTLKDFKEFNL